MKKDILKLFLPSSSEMLTNDTWFGEKHVNNPAKDVQDKTNIYRVEKRQKHINFQSVTLLHVICAKHIKLHHITKE